MGSKKVREGGVELLRIVLMLFIVGHHINLHGAGLYTPAHLAFDSWGRLAMNSVFAVSVNTFVFISGYYGMKLRMAPLIGILSQCWFYSITIGAVFLLTGLRTWESGMIWQFVFPISTDLWWFITCYVMLMLFCPVLNAVGNRLERSHLGWLVLALFTMESGIGYVWDSAKVWGDEGYTTMNFILIYMIALYLRRFHTIRSRVFYASVWVAATIPIFLIAVYMALTGGNVGNWAYSYNSPLLIIAAAAWFFVFKSIKVDAKWVFSCASLVLAVYLIHDHPWVRHYLYFDLLKIHTFRMGLKFFAVLPVLMLGIFGVCIAIEAVRRMLFRGIEKAVLEQATVRAIDEALAEAQTIPKKPQG